MKKLNLKIEGKECILYTKENENTEYVLIQPVDEHDINVLDNEVRYISENTSKNFIQFIYTIYNFSLCLNIFNFF